MTLKPSCFSYSINFAGYGTPVMEQSLSTLFPLSLLLFLILVPQYMFPRDLIYKGSCSEIFT